MYDEDIKFGQSKKKEQKEKKRFFTTQESSPTKEETFEKEHTEPFMKLDFDKAQKKDWLNSRHYNLTTACSAQKYDIVFNISLEILEKYPYDNYALYSYATCLCINGELEQAKTIFEFLLKKMDISKCKFVLTCLMRVEFNLGNFDKAYDYLIEIKNLFPTENVRLYEKRWHLHRKS